MRQDKYKRTSRKMAQTTKDKISKRLKGRKFSEEHKRRISEGMKEAWEKIPIEK